jgi:collagen type V/XI/XXIV/XXVII alpha
MNFLRLLSEEGSQNFTYTCTNSVAWHKSDDIAYNHNLSLRFLGNNGDEFSYNGTRPHVVVDGCRSRKGKAKTVFVIHTKRLQKLPLIDFYPIDYGSSEQAFGFTVGPVCFK